MFLGYVCAQFGHAGQLVTKNASQFCNSALESFSGTAFVCGIVMVSF